MPVSHWNLFWSNGFNWIRQMKQQQIQSVGAPPCNTSTHCHDPDRHGVQLHVKIVILWTPDTNGMRHILAPKGWTSGVGSRVSRIYYSSHRLFMEVDSSAIIRTTKTWADLLIMSLEMTARFEVTLAAMQLKWVQVNIANIYNGGGS